MSRDVSAAWKRQNPGFEGHDTVHTLDGTGSYTQLTAAGMWPVGFGA